MTQLRSSIVVLFVFGFLVGLLGPNGARADSKNSMSALKNAMSQKDEAYNDYYKALRKLDHPPTPADRAELRSKYIIPAEVKEQNALRGVIDSRLEDHGITKYDPNSPEAKKAKPGDIPAFLKDKELEAQKAGHGSTARKPAQEPANGGVRGGKKKMRVDERGGIVIDGDKVPKSLEYESPKKK